MTTTHHEARVLLARAFQRVRGRPPSPVELTNVQAVAWLETRYGAALDGANWGGVHAPCGGGAVQGTDHHPDGEPYAACFAPAAGPDEGAEVLVRGLVTGRRAPVAALLGQDDAGAIALELYRTAYYEGAGETEEERIVYYAAQIEGARRAVGLGLAVEGVAEPVRPTASMTAVEGSRCEPVRVESRDGVAVVAWATWVALAVLVASLACALIQAWSDYRGRGST